MTTASAQLAIMAVLSYWGRFDSVSPQLGVPSKFRLVVEPSSRCESPTNYRDESTPPHLECSIQSTPDLSSSLGSYVIFFHGFPWSFRSLPRGIPRQVMLGNQLHFVTDIFFVHLHYQNRLRILLELAHQLI